MRLFKAAFITAILFAVVSLSPVEKEKIICHSTAYTDLVNDMTVAMPTHFELTKESIQWSFFPNVEMPVSSVSWNAESYNQGYVVYTISGIAEDGLEYDGQIELDFDDGKASISMETYLGHLSWSLTILPITLSVANNSK